jgi:hypothetical protein
MYSKIGTMFANIEEIRQEQMHHKRKSEDKENQQWQTKTTCSM